MFTLDDMRRLLDARPFGAFRLWLSDGGSVVVPSREFVLLGRRFVVIGLPDPKTEDSLIDRWTTVWYLHVTRVEMLDPGAPPFGPSPGPSESPSPAPV